MPGVVAASTTLPLIGDPLITRAHIDMLELASVEQVEKMDAYASQINEILSAFLKEGKVILVDFELEFGITPDGPN